MKDYNISYSAETSDDCQHVSTFSGMAENEDLWRFLKHVVEELREDGEDVVKINIKIEATQNKEDET